MYLIKLCKKKNNYSQKYRYKKVIIKELAQLKNVSFVIWHLNCTLKNVSDTKRLLPKTSNIYTWPLLHLALSIYLPAGQKQKKKETQIWAAHKLGKQPTWLGAGSLRTQPALNRLYL